jgi:hypothetical protein
MPRAQLLHGDGRRVLRVRIADQHKTRGHRCFVQPMRGFDKFADAFVAQHAGHQRHDGRSGGTVNRLKFRHIDAGTTNHDSIGRTHDAILDQVGGVIRVFKDHPAAPRIQKQMVT